MPPLYLTYRIRLNGFIVYNGLTGLLLHSSLHTYPGVSGARNCVSFAGNQVADIIYQSIERGIVKDAVDQRIHSAGMIKLVWVVTRKYWEGIWLVRWGWRKSGQWSKIIVSLRLELKRTKCRFSAALKHENKPLQHQMSCEWGVYYWLWITSEPLGFTISAHPGKLNRVVVIFIF